jgi:hypothetical protein
VIAWLQMQIVEEDKGTEVAVGGGGGGGGAGGGDVSLGSLR